MVTVVTMRTLRFLGLLALAMGVLAAGAVAAQDDSLAGGKERILGGHGFLPSLYVSEPWVATAFQNFTGGGVAMDLQTPVYGLRGNELFILQGDLFFMSMGLGFQQRLGDSFALGMKFAGSTRTGTNAQSLVAEGIDLNRSANLWFKYRVLRSDKSQFTAGLNWDYEKTFIITPQEFARAIIDGADLDTAILLHDVKSWTSLLTLDYAYAFSPTWALRANGQVGLYEVPFTRGVSKPTHRIGLLVEMDLKPKLKIPLGLTLGRTQGLPSDDPNTGVSGTLFGVWYTGRDHFVVGVETGYMKLPVFESEEKIDGRFGVFLVRYYF